MTENMLTARVSDLRDRIVRVRKRSEPIGEEDTKRVFVNPLLQALGWDIQDLDEVKNQYRHRPQDNPVDYALFMMRTPCLFVEAKPLNASLDDRKWTTQTIGYAATAGVEWCVLTNGDEYRLYNAHAPVDADEKLFRKVRLSENASDMLTVETLDLLSKGKMEEKRLNVLWKAHFVDRRVKAVLEALIHNQDASLVRLLRKKTTGLTHGDILNSLKRADVQVGFPTPIAQPQRDGEKVRRRKEQVPEGDTDTVVVPARSDGVDEVFLGENRWYAIRIGGTMQPQIKHIALYQVAPISAITHVAPVKSIEPWKDTGKYVVNFATPANAIGPIPLLKGGRIRPLQNLRYTALSRLESAKTIDDIW